MASPTGEVVQNMLESFLTSNTCQPTSNKKETYFERLKTYTYFSWGNKPEAVAALECARFGWCNGDTDVLHCDSCKAVLSGQLPSRSQSEAYKQAVTRLTNSLANGHHQFCPWTTSQCPESFAKPWLWTRQEAQAYFASSVASFQHMNNSVLLLPVSPLIHCEGIDWRLLEGIVEGNEKALQLSAVGWRCGNATPPLLTLKCDLCVREIGIWRYLPVEDKSKKMIFYPEAEHLPWCPWVKQVSDGDDDSTRVPGWAAFVGKLIFHSPSSSAQKDSRIKKTSMLPKLQQIKRIRSLLMST